MLSQDLKENKIKNMKIDNDVAMFFVGSVVPDESNYHTEAFSRAGVMFQINLLNELKSSGLINLEIYSYELIPVYPKSKKIYIIEKKNTSITKNLDVTLVSFINLMIFKQLHIGINILIQIVKWGKRNIHKNKKIIYAYNLTVPPGIFLLIGSKLAKATLAVSINDIVLPENHGVKSFFRKIDLWLHRIMIPKINKIIVVNKSIALDFGKKNDFLVMEGGVNSLEIKRWQGLTRSNKGKNKFKVVFAGSIEPINGIDCILGAFYLLKNDNIELYIAGRGSWTNKVITATRNYKHIKYTGFLNFEEVNKLYSNADLLLNIRMTEKKYKSKYFFPSKLIEYLVTGIPTITTEFDGLEDDYKSICFVLKDENPRSLAELISQIKNMDISERKKIGDAARSFIKTNKTWHHQAERVKQYLFS